MTWGSHLRRIPSEFVQALYTRPFRQLPPHRQPLRFSSMASSTSSSTPRRNVIFDCDPGIDDALMLLMAFADHDAANRLNILGVTTVAGNVDIRNVTRNAVRLVELSGRHEIPVFEGHGEPLKRAPIVADHFHGIDGLNGALLPEPTKVKVGDEHAVEFIARSLREIKQSSDASSDESSVKKISIVASGPLTNLAKLVEEHHDALDAIDEVIVMGGSTKGGNVTPHAEFNFFADPHAAHQVLSSGLNVTMFGLNLTWQFRFSSERMARLAELNAVGKHLADMFPGESDTLHDPTLVVYLLRPDLFTFRSDAEARYVAVEISDEEGKQHRHGECLLSGDPHAHVEVKEDVKLVPKPVNIAETIKHEEAYELLLDLIRAYA